MRLSYLFLTPLLLTSYSPYHLLFILSLLFISLLLYFLNPQTIFVFLISLKLNSQDILLSSPLGWGLGVRPSRVEGESLLSLL